MSIESMVTVLNAGNLTPRRKLILLGIANHDGDGGSWPSISTLARYAVCSERTVQRELQRLTQEGFVSIELQGGGTPKTRRDRRPNLYRINMAEVVNNSCHGVTQGDAPLETRGDTALSSRGDSYLSPETSLNPMYENKLDSYAFAERFCVAPECGEIALHGKFRCQEHHRSDRISSTDALQIITSMDTDECIRWPLSHNTSGHAAMKGTTVSKVLLGLKPGDSRVSRHTCHNAWCVNPRHLKAGTAQENSDDMKRAGRWQSGKGAGRRGVSLEPCGPSGRPEL